VPDEELKKIMNRAEISVQTSHTEGMSIALMEHMMFGLAIVATDVGDTAIAIEDGVSGIVIPPKDERRLTDALRQLLADRQLRKRLGAAARKRAVDRFSIPAMVQRAADEYSALVERT
jgi:glycosyltransferase involved in cell wall biosynthesis